MLSVRTAVCGTAIGWHTALLVLMIKIAAFRRQTTGRAHNNAPPPGSAGVPGCVKLAAGVVDLMDAKAVPWTTSADGRVPGAAA